MVDIQQLQLDLQSDDCRVVAEAAAALLAAGMRMESVELAMTRQCMLRERHPRRQFTLARTYLHLLGPEEGSREAARLLRASADPEVRDEAFHTLIECGAAALPALRDLARSRHPTNRWYAYRALHRLDGPEALQILVDGLGDDEGGARLAATFAVLDRGAEAFRPVVHAVAIRRPTPAFHRAARKVLRRVTPPEAREATQPLLASLGGRWSVYESWYTARALLQHLDSAAETGTERAARGGV